MRACEPEGAAEVRVDARRVHETGLRELLERGLDRARLEAEPGRAVVRDGVSDLSNGDGRGGGCERGEYSLRGGWEVGERAVVVVFGRGWGELDAVGVDGGVDEKLGDGLAPDV